MLAEKRYRTAIVALRDGRWEEAGRHLLALASDNPDYRDVSGVLTRLQDTRPVDYWCAVFAFSEEQGARESAATAVTTLEQIEPTLPRLSEMRERLEAIPGETADEAAAIEAASTEDSPDEAFAVQPEPQSLERILTDNWDEREEDVLREWLGDSEQAAALEREEALLADAEFPTDRMPVPELPLESAPEIPEGDVQSAPISEDLEALDAGLSDDFLHADVQDEALLDEEDTTPHVVPDILRASAMSAYDTRPYALPESGPQSSDVPLFVRIGSSSREAGWDEPPAASPPAYPSSGAGNEWPAPAPLAPQATPSIIVHGNSRRSRKPWLLLLVLGLIAAVVVIAVLAARNSAPPSPAGDGGQRSEALPHPDNLPALIAAIDRQMVRLSEPAQAYGVLESLRSATDTFAGSSDDLRAALQQWIAYGQGALTAAETMNTVCAEKGVHSEECRSAVQNHSEHNAEVQQAREQVCALTPCPENQEAGPPAQ